MADNDTPESQQHSGHSSPSSSTYASPDEREEVTRMPVVPLESAQIAPEAQAEAEAAQLDDQDEASKGAWSTTITPLQEKDGFFSADSQVQHPASASRPVSPTLQLPERPEERGTDPPSPRKYEEDHLELENHTRLHPSSQRRGSHVSMEEELDLDAIGHVRAEASEQDLENLSEFERAGLDFVDIRLDGQGGNAIYGPGSIAAAKSRTSLEIRSDFVSSETRTSSSKTDQSEGSALRKLNFWSRVNASQAEEQQNRQDGDLGAVSSAPPPIETMSSSTSSSTVDSEPGRRPRSAQGRYRGRISQPSSPLPSPVMSRRVSQVDPYATSRGQSDPDRPETPTRGLTLMVEDLDGTMEVVDVDRSYFGQQVSSGSSTAPAISPVRETSGEIQPPPPEATTNESQEGLDAKKAEIAAANSMPAEGSVTSPQGDSPASSAGGMRASWNIFGKKGGRSAGPVASSSTSSDNPDVRKETFSEAKAREASTAASTNGGRSAGPIDAGPQADSQPSTTQPGPDTPATASTANSGGRSAGPILTQQQQAEPAPAGVTRRPSKGPSALEKYASRTRMTTLPPKDRNEDQRHLRDFEDMMREFKVAEAKRAKEDEDRQRQKEDELRSMTTIWEEEILKDWRVARSNTRLREVWWKGIPGSLRGRAWSLAIGNQLMLPRNLCATTKTRVAELKAKGQWPPGETLSDADREGILAAMEEDMERTLPSLKLFQEDGGVMHEDLKEVLECLVLLRTDETAELKRQAGRASLDEGSSRASSQSQPSASSTSRIYVSGLALICAPLLLNLSQGDTLVAVLNLIHSKPWLKSVYSVDPAQLKDSEAFERVLNTLLADQLPKIYANMQAQGVSPSSYARDWVRQLFVPLLPLEVLSRIWDNLFLEENDSILFRTCLALVSLLSSRLYVSDKKELTSILQGKNRAALSVWYRFLQQDPDAASVQAVASLPKSPLKSRQSRRASSLGTALDAEEAQEEEDHVSDLPPPPVPSSLAALVGESSPVADEGSASLPSNEASPSLTPLSSIEAPASWIPRDSLFSIYAIGEENLFRTLEEQVGLEGFWKESKFERLVNRELGG